MRDRRDSRPPALILVMLLAFLLAVPAQARDRPAERAKRMGPQSPQIALVLAALKAAQKGEASALKEMINGPRLLDASDPWYIAHEMILRQRWREAERFSAAGAWKGVRHLAAYVRAFGRRSPSVDQWALLQRALAHREQEEWGDVIELIEAIDEKEFDRIDVVTIRLRLLQIEAYQELRQSRDVLALACMAAQEALELGWLVAARDLHQLWLGAAVALQAHEEKGAACDGLGAIYKKMGEPQKAARSLINSASARASLGLIDGAVQGYGEVLADFRPVLDDALLIHLFNSLAMGEQVLGRYAPALRDAGHARVLAEVALVRAQASLGAAREAVKGALGALAAETLPEETLPKETLPEETAGRAADANVLALRAAEGAVRTAAREVRLLEELLPWVYQTIGSLLVQIRDYDEAERMFGRSIALLLPLKRKGRSARRVKSYLEEARANLDELELYRVREGDGDIDLAEQGLRERLAYFRRHRKENARYIEVALSALAEIQRYRALQSRSPAERSRLLAEARRTLEAVADRQRDLLDPLGRCITLRELAEVLRAEGNSEGALHYLRMALTLARRMSADQQRTQCLAALAEVELERKKPRPQRALEYAHAGVLGISALFDTLPPGLASLARGRTARIYTAGLRAAVMLHDEEEAFYFLDGARAGALRTGMERYAMVRAAKVDEQLLADEARARRHEALAYGALLSSYEDPEQKFGDRQAANRKFNAARLKRRAALQLVQLDRRLKAQLRFPDVVLPEEVRMSLAPGEAMVLQGMAGDQAVAVVLTQKKIRLVSLGKAAAIRDACSALNLDDDPESQKTSLARLRSLVIEPLGLSHEVKRVLFSCTGCLAYKPPSLLFPFREVVCVSSASAYATSLSARPAIHGKVLAIGDPVYGAIPDQWGRAPRIGPKPGPGQDPFPHARGGFERLPNSGPEIDAIGDIILRGKDASETRVVAMLNQTESLRAVHFAVHAQADEGSPHFSALALTPSAEDDGLLTALEIYQLRINADLVILSACESGRGLNAGLEGIVGLTNAFLLAGARRVLVSLWKVDDEASSVLMIEFHRLWNHTDPAKRLGAAAALRAAQKHVREYSKTHKDRLGKPIHPEWEKPLYWAAWQLWGAGD